MSSAAVAQFVLYLLVLTGGLCIGSFLNVVIHRGPVMWKLTDQPTPPGPYSLAVPRSHCPDCMRTIRVAHLIPLVGYLLIRGRCPDCGARISWRYPFVEFLGGSAALLAVGLHGFTLTAMMFFVFFCFLIALAAIDLRTMYLPDALTLPFAALGIGTNLFGLFASFPAALIGAIAGGGTFWLIGAFYFKARGIDGLGLGDAKLMGGIGAWLGWTALPFVILAASVSALLFILTRRLSGWAVTRETTIPFGPFLAAGAGLIMVLHAASPAFWQL